MFVSWETSIDFADFRSLSGFPYYGAGTTLFRKYTSFIAVALVVRWEKQNKTRREARAAAAAEKGKKGMGF